MSHVHAPTPVLITGITLPDDGDMKSAAIPNGAWAACLDYTAYMGAILEGLNPTFPVVIWINTGCSLNLMGGSVTNWEATSQSQHKSGSHDNFLSGAEIMWLKGSLPTIQTVVEVNATTGGPAGYNFRTGTFLGVKTGGIFSLDAGSIASNDTVIANTGTVNNVGPSAGFIETQVSGVDADHLYRVGVSWVDKIDASGNAGNRNYAFARTGPDLITPIESGRKVVVTFGNIAGLTGGATSLALRDGSLAGPVLITLVSTSGYMSAELTFNGSVWYVSQPGVRT